MTIAKYIGMDVHKESISIAVMNSTGKFVMECVIDTKASMLLQFIDGLRGDVRVTFEEGTWRLIPQGHSLTEFWLPRAPEIPGDRLQERP
jgi:hypothetical protein